MQSILLLFIRSILIFTILFIPNLLIAQNHTLSGKVIDGSTSEPLPFTNILIKNLNRGVSCGLNGEFSFNLPSESYNMIVSFVGYKTFEFPVKISDKDTTLLIRLYSTDNLLQTVTVYSGTEKKQSEEISHITLQNEKVEAISSVLRDVFRAVSTLPGVSSNNEMNAKYNVRGGSFDENLILINGTQVYEPFHIKEAPEASVGIFCVDLMRKVDLMTGGYTAQFGDKMSSVLNIDYREGNKEKYCGNFSLNSLSLDGILEGPISSSGSFIMAVRKSYFEYIISYLGYEEQVKPSYYDIQGTISYNLAPANKLLFQFIHAGDDFKLEPFYDISNRNGSGTYRQENVSYTINNTDFDNNKSKYFSNLFDLQSINILSENSILKAELSLYNQIDDEYDISTTSNIQNIKSTQSDKTYFYEYKSTNLYSNYLKINTWDGKLLFNYKPALYHEIKSGIDYQRIYYDQNLLQDYTYNTINNTDKYPDTTKISTKPASMEDALNLISTESYKYSGFIEDIWQISERLVTSIGGRFDYFDINKDFSLSPRFSIAYNTEFGSTIRAAWGYFYQSPNYSQLAYSFSSDSNAKSQLAIHYLLGFEHKFNTGDKTDFLIKIEAYYKDYDNLIGSDRSSRWRVQYSKKNDSKGYAKGIDVYASYMIPGFSCWLSYGLLEAKEKNNNTNVEYFRMTNQTHTLSLVTEIGLGKNWDLNMRIAYGSGYPYTPYYSQYNNLQKKWEWIQGAKNSENLPFYKRVDARLSKSFMIGNFPLSAYLDIINLFNSHNVLSYRFSYDDNGYPKKKELSLFPIIPAIGISVKY